MKDILRRKYREFSLPGLAKQELRRDRQGLPDTDTPLDEAVRAAMDWLVRAQDKSASQDGGVARDFSLIKGWATSYPETTGYIVPTILEGARRKVRPDLRERGRRMLDWMVSIQFPEGGFQGGKIDSTPVVPVTFNTGQILIGLAAGVAEFGESYVEPTERAAAWLADTMDDDGCWRNFPTPFAAPGEKAYETHVSWGLFEAERVRPGKGYGDAGLKNVSWALTKQRPNGWFDSNCLTMPSAPLTHTIGYVLRGVLEGYRLSEDRNLLTAAQKTADGVLSAIGPDGYLPGRLDADWQPAVSWVCLTGSVQIAHCWLMLYGYTGNEAYRDAAFAANAYVRRTIRMTGNEDQLGAVKGAFPVDGGYGSYEYLNWAAKFFIDSHWLERDIRLG